MLTRRNLHAASNGGGTAGINGASTSTASTHYDYSFLNLRFIDPNVASSFEIKRLSTKLSMVNFCFFFVFAILVSLQYSSVFPAGANGKYGSPMRIAFIAWPINLVCLTAAFTMEIMLHEGSVFTRFGWSPQRFYDARDFFINAFITLQPVVHGFILFGRTQSPQKCTLTSYAAQVDGAFSVHDGDTLLSW